MQQLDNIQHIFVLLNIIVETEGQKRNRGKHSATFGCAPVVNIYYVQFINTVPLAFKTNQI